MTITGGFGDIDKDGYHEGSGPPDDAVKPVGAVAVHRRKGEPLILEGLKSGEQGVDPGFLMMPANRPLRLSISAHRPFTLSFFAGARRFHHRTP